MTHSGVYFDYIKWRKLMDKIYGPMIYATPRLKWFPLPKTYKSQEVKP